MGSRVARVLGGDPTEDGQRNQDRERHRRRGGLGGPDEERTRPRTVCPAEHRPSARTFSPRPATARRSPIEHLTTANVGPERGHLTEGDKS